MTEALTVAERAVPRTRQHHVTAVVVAHDGRRWLPRTLRSLAASQRRPEVMVAVDAGSRDGSGELLAASGLFADVIEADAAASFGAAIRLALADLPTRSGVAGIDPGPDADATSDAEHVIDLTDSAREPTIDLRDGASTRRPAPASGEADWIWLLHDDCAVSPDTLAELLRAADAHPDAAIIGPKARGWTHPDVILQAGVTVTGAGRMEMWVLPGEVDQGQYDHRIDVLAVGSAGMLVRRDVWERLGGFDEALPLFRDDLDFCYRARRAGERVIVATDAIVFHRQAAYHGKRSGGEDEAGDKRYQMRRAGIYQSLVHTPTWRLPFRLARILIVTALRVLADLISLSPHRAYRELRASLSGAFSWRQLRRSRAKLRAVAQVAPKELQWLRPTPTQRAIHWQEAAARYADSGDDEHLSAVDRLGRSLSALGGVVLPLLVVCLAAAGSLWFSAGSLVGGALLPTPESSGALWQSFLAPWHEVGLGSAVPAPPYLALVAGSALLALGGTAFTVQVLLLLAPVLAGISALIALRGFASRGIGIMAAVAYALVPATITAVGQGRLGTAVAAALLPLAARALARATGLVGRLEYRGWRSIAFAALWMAALAAFVPTLAVVLLGLAGLACLVARHGRAVGRVVFITLAVVVVLWPWSGYVLANPGLLLLEIGADPPLLAGQAGSPLGLLALNPGGPAAPPLVLALPLLALAVLALVRARTRAVALMAWIAILVALLVGTFQLTYDVMIPSSTLPVSPWPGGMALLIGAATVFAAAVAASNVVGRGRVIARGGAVIATLTALVLAGWWLFGQEALLFKGDDPNRSAFVTSEATGPGAPRSLLITQSGGDRPVVGYQLLSGAGPQLGDAEMAPDAATMAAVDLAVARLVAGGSDVSLETLARASVQYITVDTRADRALARTLDAVPGLRRVSTVDGRALWSVSGWLPRVRALMPSAPAQQVPVQTVNPALSVAAPVPAGATGVELAESPNALWQASVSGQELATAPDTTDHQVFTVPSGAAGDLSISVNGGPRTWQLFLALAGLVLLAAMAASTRGRHRRPRRVAPVPEPAGDGIDGVLPVAATPQADVAHDDENAEVSR